MTLVKICGIRAREHAIVAAGAGADMIGFVFVPVRREVKPGAAAEIIRDVRQGTDNPPLAIGLFVNDGADQINAVVEQVGLDMVQFSGDESPELAGSIDVPVIKAVRLSAGTHLDDARRVIEDHLRYSAAVLIDSHVVGQWGGTGVRGDWNTVAELATGYPVVLAGGLEPQNVGKAIRQVNPAMVDVSSGIETDGQKDPDKIRAFLEEARSADQAPSSAAAPFTEMVHALSEHRSAGQIPT